jgi:hypothetical protein
MLHSMRSLIIVVALAAAAVLAAGCGDTTSTKTAPTKTVTTAKTTTAASSPATAPDCGTTGMSTRKGAEGTCTADGSTITMVNPGHEARLRGLSVRLSGCRQASGDSVRQTSVRCSITVRNRSDVPRTFDGAGKPQTMLVVDGKQFYESSGAEKHAMQPAESLTRAVVYDLPPRFARDLQRSGNLFVFDFGADGNNAGQAAMLHTYR